MAKRKNNKKLIFTTISILIFFITIIISYSDNPNIPKWNDIYKVFNISKGTINEDYSSYPLSVHIIDVGKADAIYIKSNNSNILIDAGDTDTKDKIVQYLKNNNVEKLDLVIATHPHKDHIAGMPNVINSFHIDRFIMPELPEKIVPTTKTYMSMLKALDSKSVFAENPVIGNNFNIDDLNIEILGPTKKYEDLNNNSVVAKLKYKDISFLFTGDAEKEAEADMIASGVNLKSTVLKVGHHGSKTSSTQEFLNAVKPKYSVISVGPDSNNLPKDSTLQRIKKNNIKNYRTDNNGTVVVVTDGTDIKIFTEH